MDQKLSLKERLGYGLGTTGEQFPNFLVQTFLFAYFNLVVGLNAGIIATIMLIARVWDAVNDPIMGVIADRTRSRWGSYRPWAFFATIPMAIFLVLTFTNVGGSTGFKAVYCAVMYILFGMSNTASLIPLGSMANVLTEDSQERAVLGTFRELGSSIGNLAGSILVPLIVTAFVSSGMGEARGYQLTAIVLGILLIVFVGITFFTTKERVVPPKPEGNILKSFLVLKGNVPGICIILFFFFIATAIITRQMFNAYYGMFVLGNEGLGNSLLVVMSIAAFCIMYFGPMMVKKWGKKPVLYIGCGLVILGGLIFWVAGTNGPLNLIASFIVGMGQNLTFSGVWSIIPDTADYGEYKNGHHAPGAMYAIANFGMKMGMTLASSLMGWGLMWAGFDETAAVQAAGVASGLRTFNALSLIIPTVCAILVMIPYKLTAEKSAEVVKALEERRAAEK
ncbi:MAG: MFS transporter [Oscillospiraceae bacterium]|nr:MFS transporter [Oscillospiraceae bacterium]